MNNPNDMFFDDIKTDYINLSTNNRLHYIHYVSEELGRFEAAYKSQVEPGLNQEATGSFQCDQGCEDNKRHGKASFPKRNSIEILWS